jgi:broad specificity phosphatase PhoE
VLWITQEKQYTTPMSSAYHPDLSRIPFMLARHGESKRNASEMEQGRGDEVEGLPANGLTDIGRLQTKAMHSALVAAGITVEYVNSSPLLRAKETARGLVRVHPDPKPLLAKTPVSDLEEMSQKGWETVHTRNEVKELRREALAEEIRKLSAAGLASELGGYAAWIAPLGDGESPLGAALRGISALEGYRPRPGELIVSHAMLNKYMDAVATHVPSSDRLRLLEMVSNTSELDKVAVINGLHALGLPAFQIADDWRNQQTNGGVTEYTIDPTTDLWIAGRRIELPKPSDTALFVEYQRSESGLWERVTQGDTSI